MKRLSNTSPSLPRPRHPKDEEYVDCADGGYSKEFLAMLDSLEREDCGELAETGLGKKRRLSSAQVSALERCFAAENKLEPERKARLADELGLQPRQVAIWFQNRRARWKTKRLEKDYGALKAEFGSLKLCFDELRLQNEALANKVREMKAKVCVGDQSDRESTESVKEESPGNNGGESDGLDHRRDEEDDDTDNTQITTATKQGSFQPYELLPNSDLLALDGSSNSDRDRERNLNFSLALNASSSSSSSSPSALMASWFQASSDSSRALPANNLSALLGAPSDEPNCSNFFSVDQAPALYWYLPEP